MSSAKSTKPLLNETQWIKNGSLKMQTETGLAYDQMITSTSRRHVQFEFGQRLLSHIKKLRLGSRVVINPKHLEVGELLKIMEEDQEATGVIEYKDFSFGMFDSDFNGEEQHKEKVSKFDTQWRADYCDPLTTESQTLVAVIFDPLKPVGFTTFQITLTHPVEGEFNEYILRYEWYLLFVMPSRRGEGFGLDLSLACAEITRDILLGVCHTLPANSVVLPCLNADIDSKSGEIFISEIAVSIHATSEEFNHKSVTILPPQINYSY